MTRSVIIEADDYDLPVLLQVVQEADASWNGENVELTLNLVIAERLEILRAPITPIEAAKFLNRLQAALDKAADGGN
jgi:hypothetical protein